eukprot:SAG11_NODE_1995_length_3950_cov_42.467151_2_plen_128_part_00
MSHIFYTNNLYFFLCHTFLQVPRRTSGPTALLMRLKNCEFYIIIIDLLVLSKIPGYYMLILTDTDIIKIKNTVISIIRLCIFLFIHTKPTIRLCIFLSIHTEPVIRLCIFLSIHTEPVIRLCIFLSK